jgi:hypothetical protein
MGVVVTPAFPLMEGWFSRDERTTCPFCRPGHAIANESASMLVCLTCAAVSIPDLARAGRACENGSKEA